MFVSAMRDTLNDLVSSKDGEYFVFGIAADPRYMYKDNEMLDYTFGHFFIGYAVPNSDEKPSKHIEKLLSEMDKESTLEHILYTEVDERNEYVVPPLLQRTRPRLLHRGGGVASSLKKQGVQQCLNHTSDSPVDLLSPEVDVNKSNGYDFNFLTSW
ncbi:hypothetical protein LWI29_029788 [Acer saccharum]|uniref:Uncharacterized protein n=1 Tax=Acer saccharum TaxID=4024 RepID=A0AA39V9N5_ACESA|nr:hypothetical protein LWI29_029788 [Acer saccharum]